MGRSRGGQSVRLSQVCAQHNITHTTHNTHDIKNTHTHPHTHTHTHTTLSFFFSTPPSTPSIPYPPYLRGEHILDRERRLDGDLEAELQVCRVVEHALVATPRLAALVR